MSEEEPKQLKVFHDVDAEWKSEEIVEILVEEDEEELEQELQDFTDKVRRTKLTGRQISRRRIEVQSELKKRKARYKLVFQNGGNIQVQTKHIYTDDNKYFVAQMESMGFTKHEMRVTVSTRISEEMGIPRGARYLISHPAFKILLDEAVRYIGRGINKSAAQIFNEQFVFLEGVRKSDKIDIKNKLAASEQINKMMQHYTPRNTGDQNDMEKMAREIENDMGLGDDRQIEGAEIINDDLIDVNSEMIGDEDGE